jgi:hypothetical protein
VKGAFPPVLVEQLRGRITDPARQVVVEQLVADVAQLQVRAVAGEPLEQELAHVRAQVSSLTATEAAFVRDAWVGWIGMVTREVVHAAFGMVG